MPTFDDAARECAQAIYDSQKNLEKYKAHIRAKKDPRTHLRYQAAIVLNYTEAFEADIAEFENRFETPSYASVALFL